MEIILETVAIALGVYLLARIVLSIVIDVLTERVIEQQITANLDQGHLIAVVVERAQDQYLCFDAKTKSFVCQGQDLKELLQRFKLRFPQSKMAIFDGDADTVKMLQSQLESLKNENLSGQ